MYDEGQVFRPGLYVPARNEAVSVGATSTQVCQARNESNKRMMFLIRNTSDAAGKIITLHLGQGAAVASNGIVLLQNESYLESNDKGFECHQDSIQAICALAGGQVSVVER